MKKQFVKYRAIPSPCEINIDFYDMKKDIGAPFDDVIDGDDKSQLEAIKRTAYLIAAAPEMFDFLEKNFESLRNYFDGLEGPYSDNKNWIADLIKKVKA